MSKDIKKTCLHCGKEYMAGAEWGLYCSRLCQSRHNREMNRAICLYNDGVVCGAKICDFCGWNPEVAKQRLERLMEVHHD